MPTRREFVSKLVTACAAGGVLNAGSRVAVPGPGQPHCQILDLRGEPVPAEELTRFHICDFLLRPIPIDPQFGPGEIHFEPPERPFRISVPLVVPGLGHMYVYADNRGRGYTPQSFLKSEPLFLNYEFAADRLETVRRLTEECRSSGIEISGEARRRTEQAQVLLKKADAAGADRRAAARAWGRYSRSGGGWSPALSG